MVSIWDKPAIFPALQNLTDTVHIGADHAGSGGQGLDDGDPEPFEDRWHNNTLCLVVQRIKLIIRNKPQEGDIPFQSQSADKSLHFLQAATLSTYQELNVRNVIPDEGHAPDQKFDPFPFVNTSDIEQGSGVFLYLHIMKSA